MRLLWLATIIATASTAAAADSVAGARQLVDIPEGLDDATQRGRAPTSLRLQRADPLVETEALVREADAAHNHSGRREEAPPEEAHPASDAPPEAPPQPSGSDSGGEAPEEAVVEVDNAEAEAGLEPPTAGKPLLQAPRAEGRGSNASEEKGQSPHRAPTASDADAEEDAEEEEMKQKEEMHPLSAPLPPNSLNEAERKHQAEGIDGTEEGDGEKGDEGDVVVDRPAAWAMVGASLANIPWICISVALAVVITLMFMSGALAVLLSLLFQETHYEDEEVREGQLVTSPYSGKREDKPRMRSLVLQLVRLFRICVPSMCCKQANFLIKSVTLALIDGILECLVPLIIVKPLHIMVSNNQLADFRYFAFFMMLYNFMISMVKAAANYYAMRGMIACRRALVMHMHALYMSRSGRVYYTLGNLDSRVNTPDARITNDTDLLMQFLFEFVFGGIMKPEAGMCSLLFFLTASLGVAYNETEATAVGWGIPSILIALAIVAVSLVPTIYAMRTLTSTQAEVQGCEAAHRAAHVKCRLFAESVCFYAGEDTEKKQLDNSFNEVRGAFGAFALSKFYVDLIQMVFYFGIAPISAVLAAFIVRKSDHPDKAHVGTLFYVLFLTFQRIIRCCMEISKNIVDLAKAQAMLHRVIQLLEVMDAFVAFDMRKSGDLPMGEQISRKNGALFDEEEILCCMSYYRVREMPSGDIVSAIRSPGILFEHVNVYTPDGLRLLIQDVSLKLDPGESCLVMGPSGIGKSSLLRVLGQLWPLFRGSGEAGQRAKFCRPGPLNVFFLAQRPYLFEGTLREQVAYPVWDESLLRDLDDTSMEGLFKVANLSDVWEARKDELDEKGFSWEDVLSLGEQQRLQFCRLFWHAEWHRRHGDGEGFFAVLDESSASMDTTSEMQVYQECCRQHIGFLSVAHRPTVIQFHSKVLQFEFDTQHELHHRIRDAKEMAMESAHQITDEGNNNTELRAPNCRRSISIQNMQSLKDGKELVLERTRSTTRIPGRSSSVMSLSSMVMTNDQYRMRSSANVHGLHSQSHLASQSTTNIHVMGAVGSDDEADEEHDFLELQELWQGTPEDEDEELIKAEAERLESGAPVLTPYVQQPENSGSRLGTLGNLWRLVLICHSHGFLLAAIIGLNLLSALFVSLWIVIFANFKLIMCRRPGQVTHFQAFGMDTGYTISYEMLVPIVIVWGPLQGALKAYANYLTVLLMIEWRTNLARRLQAMYLHKSGRLYYTLSNLDMRVDAADQRITNDVDLLMQFLFEFFFGGVMKPDSGVLFKGSVFLMSCCIMWMEVGAVCPSQAGLAPGAAFGLFAITFFLTERLGRRCGEAQQLLQAKEGALRAAHARCQTFAEGISFYGGEETERVMLDIHYAPVVNAFMLFAKRKFPLEVLQLMLYQGQYTIAMLLGGFVAFKEAEHPQIRSKLFDITNTAMVSCLQALNKITCQALDFAKVGALSSRVSHLYEVMESFLLYEEQMSAKSSNRPSTGLTPIREVDPLIDRDTIGCCCPYEVVKLRCGALVPMEQSQNVVFEHVDVYTPDGLRLLLEDVTLRLEPGERCLIMGPSGIGKSSLLRILGQLWPLFRTPNDRGRRSRFSRPGPFNMFFLAQRPYLFEGTLREQVAYPMWSDSLIEELSDEWMERLFREANLVDVWNMHREALDVEGHSWADVLSLGEQQRLQFCRLFWHHEWVMRHNRWQEIPGLDSSAFFAVLDESSASMDTESERIVYKMCCERRISILSVAHRPTVIQFHSKVLHFEFDDHHELRHRVRDAKMMAKEMATLLTKHLDVKHQSWPGHSAPRTLNSLRKSPDAPRVQQLPDVPLEFVNTPHAAGSPGASAGGSPGPSPGGSLGPSPGGSLGPSPGGSPRDSPGGSPRSSAAFDAYHLDPL